MTLNQTENLYLTKSDAVGTPELQNASWAMQIDYETQLDDIFIESWNENPSQTQNVILLFTKGSYDRPAHKFLSAQLHG